MDIDASTVLGVVSAIAGPAIAVWRTSENAKRKAYDDARKDLGDCRKTSEAQAEKIDGLSGEVDLLKAGLADCQEKHGQAERLSVGMRAELDELRRSIRSGR